MEKKIIPPRNDKVEILDRNDESTSNKRIIELVEIREEMTRLVKETNERIDEANAEILDYIMAGEADTIRHEGLQIERVVTTRSGWDNHLLDLHVDPNVLLKCRKPSKTSHYVKVTRPK